MFETVDVTIKLITEMLGTVPKDPEIYASYIETKKPEDITEDESKTVEKIEEKGWTGFHVDKNGLFIYEYMIKGFLKQAGNVLKIQADIKALRSKIDDQIFIQPRRIYLGQDKPDGVIERPLRAMTMQGPRITLARSDYINAGKEINFQIKILEGGSVKLSVIQTLLEYGQMCGLGQFRNGGYGRFEVVNYW